MNKLDMIETLKTEAGLTKSEATDVEDLFFDEMSNALERTKNIPVIFITSKNATESEARGYN